MYSKINDPYNLSSEDEKIIAGNFKSHNDWDKNVFDSIKASIVDDLRPKQENKCCYCRTELGFDIKAVDIEHVIPKSQYPQFTFYTKNLALSCPGCNTSKGKKNVLGKPIKRYPRSGNNLIIIHPHFDDYFSNIAIHDGAIYEGLNDKGCETIKQCKIYRLKEVIKKKKALSTNLNPIQSLVENIRNAGDSDKQNLLEALQALTMAGKGRS